MELELLDRKRRTVERRIRAARFSTVKSFDTFDFAAIPGLNKMLVLALARCGISCAGRTSPRSATAAPATPCRAGAWASGLPVGLLRHVHDRSFVGQPDARGALRAPPAQASARAAGGQAAHHRRTRLCAVVAAPQDRPVNRFAKREWPAMCQSQRRPRRDPAPCRQRMVRKAKAITGWRQGCRCASRDRPTCRVERRVLRERRPHGGLRW